ncbi:hypothetical protein Hanom_Chr12g01136841 [Helianthus anomalus]
MDHPPHFLPFDQHFCNFTYDDIYTHMIEQDQPHCISEFNSYCISLHKLMG